MQTLLSSVKKAFVKSNAARHILLAAMFVLFLYPLSAFAQCNDNWTGGASGSWNTAGNWSAGVPTSSSNTCISTANSAVTIGSGGSTDNLTLGLSTDSLTLSNGQVLSITAGGNISNAGTISMGSVGNATELSIAGTTILSGTGTLTMSNNSQNYILGGGTLTNQSTIQGAGNIGNGSLTLINSGLIDANQSTALAINTNGGTTNTGTMEATAGGTLQFNSIVVANTGGLIEASGSGSTVGLSGGSVTGGTLTSNSGGVLLGEGSVTLNNLTLSTGSTLDVQNGQTILFGTGTTITNNGTFNFQSVGNATELQLAGGSVTLTGGGHITFSDNSQNYIFANSTGTTLTNVNNTISGSGVIGNGSSMSFVNDAAGIVDATSALGNSLTINPAGGTTNLGLMEASSGGTLILDNTVTNTGATIEALAGGTVVLNGTDLVGGTLTSIGTGVILGKNSTFLDGTAGHAVTLSGGSTFDVQNGQTIVAQGTLTVNGTLNLQSVGNATEFQLGAGSLTLTGTGSVNLSNNSQNYFFGSSSASILTNQMLIQGAGNIGNGALTFVNSGTVNANQSAGISINANGGTTNTGTMEATAGGTLQFNSYAVANTGGLIEASGSGSTVVLNSGSVTGGTLTSNSGGVFLGEGSVTLNTLTLSTGSTLDVQNGQTILFGAGTITNNGTINLQSNGNITELNVAGNTTLAGTGTLTLSSNNQNYILGGGTFTNQETIQGAGTIGNGNLTFINSGTVDANQSAGITISANGGTTNTKTLEATAGGTLQFNSYAVTNTGGTILATGTGSKVIFNAGSITGGTLTSSSGGVFIGEGSAILNALTISAGTSVDIQNGQAMELEGIITNKGTINLGSVGNLTELVLDGNVTLTAPGKVILSANSQNFILGTGTLTNQGIIEGAGNIGDGQIGLINTGTIEANATKAPFDTLVIDASGTGFTNNVGTKEGTLTVTKSNTLIIEGGPFNNYNSTSGTLTGGKYNVTGTFEFNAGTLGIVTNDAAITLTGTVAKVLNTNESNASALTGFTTNGSAGTFTVNAGTFTDANTFTNQGIIAVGSAGKFDSTGTLTNFNSTTSTLTGGSYTLTATGQFQFNNGGDASDIITNDAKITLAGVDTTKNSFIDQSGNNALANFNANGSTGSLTLTTDRNFATTAGFTNAGTVTVSKSTGTGHTLLTINGSYQNTGTTTVDGMLTATSINVTGGFIYGNLGTITGAFDLTGGTLNPGDGLKKEGTLNIAGNYTESGSGTLNIDLDGTVAGTKYDVLNISGTAALGGTLDFDLISTFKPTVGETFDVINYSSETGSFTTVNLPTAPAGDHWVFACGATDCTLTLDSGAAGPAMSATSTHNNVASTVRHAAVHGAAIAGDDIQAPSVILARAETCGGFRTFASFACMREAVSGIASGFTHTAASHGTMASTLHNNVASHTNVASVSGVHNNVAVARGGDSASHGPTVSATSVARFYVCAYMPDELARTMGCR